MVSGLRTAPNVPWIAGSDIQSIPPPSGVTISDDLAAEFASIASELLYIASGRQFTGVTGPVTVRPLSRPVDIDTRGFRFGGFGSYDGSWGVCMAGMSADGISSHYGCSNPPEIELGAYPIIGSTIVVLIDGVTIPTDEYELEDFHILKRMRVSASASPTDRYGWPTCAIMDLPDTEPGTFSVTYSYGVAPPVTGVRAAKRLGYELALHELGKSTIFAQRTKSVTRQGVSVEKNDPIDLIMVGRTGIVMVDLFVKGFNPSGSTSPTIVWSPDSSRARRTVSS